MRPLLTLRSDRLALLLCALASAPAVAQNMPKAEYYRYLPLEWPRLVRQSQWTAQFHLFGDESDSTYRDLAPRDGVDDRRHAVLQRMATRFAPFMVLNSTSVPMGVAFFPETSTLHIDDWNTVGETGTLVQETTLDLFSAQTEPCTDPERASDSAKDDCRLLALLDYYDPDNPTSAVERARAMDADIDRFQVLYVDFPGYDEQSWRTEFESRTSGELPPRYREALFTYVHPFIDAVEHPTGDRGYELVLQYWFFYPFNDGGNNHEGDWEHVNITVSPRGAVTRPLTADELGVVLDGAWIDAPPGAGELVIKRADYYFHHKVFTLDYASPNVYLPRDEWETETRTTSKQRTSEDWFWKQLRGLAYRDAGETEINTHPVVYIGADNKGFDQILAMPGGKNRDSHGSFPFPGLYKDIGPSGATEEISSHFDHQRFFAADSAERQRLLGSWKRGGAVWLADPARIGILPDWERLASLVKSDPLVRAEWAWLLLPMRLGYPATPSPFAGIVPHAETGNLSILGPAFSQGWNRAGATVGFADYSPHRVPRLFPLGVQDAFGNSWGFLNVFAALTVLPPVDVLWRVVAAPARRALGRQDPTFYPTDNMPYRFFGFTSGISSQAVSHDFLDLAITEDHFDDVIVSILDHQFTYGDSTSVIVSEQEFADAARGPYFQLAFFIGPRIVAESVVRHARSRLGFRLQWNDIAQPYEMAGAFSLWEYAGSLRYNLATGSLLPYGKLGYGLSHFRLEHLAANEALLPVPDTRWITRWTWHAGAGIELMMIKSYTAPPRGLDVSLRGEWTVYSHNLGLELGDLPIETLVLLGRSAADLPRDRRVTRQEWRLGLTLSF